MQETVEIEGNTSCQQELDDNSRNSELKISEDRTLIGLEVLESQPPEQINENDMLNQSIW